MRDTKGRLTAAWRRAAAELHEFARRFGLLAVLQRLGWGATRLRRRAAGETTRLAERGVWLGVWRRLAPVLRIPAAIAGLVAAVWLGAAVFIAYLWPAIFSPIIDADAFAGFERAAERARGVALIDGRGRRFGVMSGEFDRDHLGELPDSLLFGGLALHPDHKTIPVADAPPAFWRCLVWLEDRGRGGWDNPFGVSFTGVLRIPYAMGLRLVGGRDPGGAAGGSTLEMQLARSMWKQYRHNSDPLIRKIREWRAAPVLHRALGAPEGGRRMRAWIASHIALVRGVGGDQGSLYGVELAGRFLFGKPADQLSEAEQLLLAASANRPVRLRETEAQRRAALAALAGTEARPGRALRCAGPAARLADGPVIPDPAARAEARRALLALRGAPYQGPFVEPALTPYLADLLEFPGGPRLEPQSVSRRLALGLQAELAAELSDRYAAAGDPRQDAHLWRGRLTALKTSVDLVASKRLEQAALAALDQATKGLKSGSSPRLAPSAFTPDGAPLLLMAMDLDGRVVRYVQTGYDSLALGQAATRPDWGAFGDGPHDPGRRTAQIGSLGKIGAALLMAEAGASDPNQRISNACVGTLSHRCMDRRRWRGGVPSASMEEAFGASLNSAVIRALLRAGVSLDRIETFAKAVGLGAPDRTGRGPAATSLVLGRLTGRPVEALRLMAAATAFAEGDAERPIPHPRLIESVSSYDPDAERGIPGRAAPSPPSPEPLRALVRLGSGGQKGPEFVRRVLEAPLCLRDRASRATLHSLSRWCAAEHPDVALHLAKTGTVGAGGPRPTDEGVFDEAAWWIAGAVRTRDGRGYVYLAMAGDGSADRPFARRLGAGRLAPAVDALLSDLTAAPERS